MKAFTTSKLSQAAAKHNMQGRIMGIMLTTENKSEQRQHSLRKMHKKASKREFGIIANVQQYLSCYDPVNDGMHGFLKIEKVLKITLCLKKNVKINQHDIMNNIKNYLIQKEKNYFIVFKMHEDIA